MGSQFDWGRTSTRWIVLAGFLLGTLFCSMDIDGQGKLPSMRDDVMNSNSNAMMTGELRERAEPQAAGMETATFAMG
jgi:hypothetical protein